MDMQPRGGGVMGVPAPAAGVPLPPAIDAALGRSFAGLPPPAVDMTYDPPAVLKYFEECKREALEGRAPYERLWWRNLLYIVGRQWIFYNQKRGQWQDKRLARWTPRPVTNFVAEAHETITALFATVQLGVLARPLGLDPKNLSTAKLADQLHPCLHAEHDMPRVIPDADFWLTATGNAFYHLWWDRRGETTAPMVVPYERCQACGTISSPQTLIDSQGTCPRCQQRAFTKAVDPQTGEPLGEVLPTGKGATDACSPFEVLVPPNYPHFGEVPFVIRQRWRAKRYYEQFFAHLVPQLRFSSAPSDRSLQLLRSAASQTDVSGTLGGWLAASGDQAQTDGIAEYELWVKPTEQFPDGLFLRLAGDSDPVFVGEKDKPPAGPLPHETADGRRLFPWVHEGFSPFGGRLFARSPIDLIIQKQDQVNQIDALTELIVQRVANPVWLKPKGAEVTQFTGEPGLIVEWNPLSAGGGRPERIAGQDIQPGLVTLRRERVGDIERLAGTYDVLKGSKPAGVEAFSAMQLLVERGQARFTLPLANRGKAYQQWYTLALELERLYGPQERIWTVLSPYRRWTQQAFKRAKLDGAVEIMVEDGSQVPKTNLGNRAAVEQLNQLGFIDKTDSDQRVAVYRLFGMTSLMPGVDIHVEAAGEEEEAFEQWAQTPGSRVTELPPGQPPPPPTPGLPEAPFFVKTPPMMRKAWHNDKIHLNSHEKWANGDVQRSLLRDRPELAQWVTFHLAQHNLALNPLPPAPPLAGANGRPPQGAALALAGSNRESGNPADVPHGAGLVPPNQGPQ